ncbi:mitochondrial ribosome small subunit component S19 [Histoplasma capsulatum G186AR]|uniref:Mitochondrial ribosome small subunit component S19 n=1 Tax=Ajellomyces capsulatus (strain G186AR / H82 / ATCC MYA-2454 / RMSCC 2432) TaxID=447093 RepID=C0NNV4_AJECG|nr:mitochondrial ribosome small subunit component S19 [Histoplasma capsulatum G186AR]EEH06614.1 mitochondrial ribosome small subunit component S19 [Histoplasma capsulatum G186AR]
MPPSPGTPAIKTQARSATILPNFVGLKFAVHNGKTYNEVFITDEMVGRKLGEFSQFMWGFCVLGSRMIVSQLCSRRRYTLSAAVMFSDAVAAYPSNPLFVMEMER